MLEASAMLALTCHRCETPGHGWRECRPPPPRTETELRERFNRYMLQVIAGHVTLSVKRQWVKEDWQAYNDAKEKARK